MYSELIAPFCSSVLFVSSIVVCFHLGKWTRRQIKVQKPDKPMDPLTKEKSLFMKLFSKPNNYTNSNIEPELYCYETLRAMQKQEKSPIEMSWKSRILFQSTLLGNIIMFYDIYKQAFAYFSDVHIPYKTLNLCAMKYVRTYFCLDFFLDASEYPEDYQNPFRKMFQEEIEKEKREKKEKAGKLNLDLQSDVFVKKKALPSLKGVPLPAESDENKKKMEYKDKFVNNFRHMGKMQNFSLLQIIEKKASTLHGQGDDNDEYHYVNFKKKQKKASFKKTFHDLFAKATTTAGTQN